MFTVPMMLPTSSAGGGGGGVWLSSVLLYISRYSYTFSVTIHNETASAIAWDCAWTGDSGTVAANSISTELLEFVIDNSDVLSGSFVAEMTAGGQNFVLFSTNYTLSLGLSLIFFPTSFATVGDPYDPGSFTIQKSGNLTDGVVDAYNIYATLDYGDGGGVSESWSPAPMSSINGTTSLTLTPTGHTYTTAGTYQITLTLTATDGMGGTATTVTASGSVEVENL